MYKVYNPYFAALIATVGGMMFGFDISSVSAFVSEDAYRTYFGYPDSVTQGGITAAMSGGSFVGALVAGALSDWKGRKLAIQTAGFFWIVGAAIQSSSQNLAQLIIGRFIAGIGIGLASSQVPVYISEIAPKRIRGRLGSLFQWAVTWGIMIMFYISYGCTHIEGPASFRTAWGIMILPGIVLMASLFLVPESPRWLASKDRWEEAAFIVSKIEAGGNLDDERAKAELEEVRISVEINRQSKNVSIIDLFAKGSRTRTFVGVSAQIWQQLTGMNVAMYYVVNLFQMAGYHGNTVLVSSSIQYVINVIMTIPALVFIDSWGRRPMLLLGAVLMMIFMFATAGLMANYGHYVDSVDGNSNLRWIVDSTSASRAIIACSYLFTASFAPTWGPGIWLYVSEIFPLHQRAVANGFCASFNWIFNFALAFFVPPAFTNIQWRTYLIFGVFCIAMFFHVFFMFPETKGKSLEEIEVMWMKKIPAWKTASTHIEVTEEAVLPLDSNEKSEHATHEEDVETAAAAPAAAPVSNQA
ncbi:hypothetical protein CANCADRAFT_126349 [Tortispora caseinolytica NRRL Y-17796]|uniref:Major facilitator superfamily (MFS) profile domain-containing protein n=1 Tax=Tortispora caseinolytica NRRL Y-17796 TaxID=767744 RepID=A0A1E4TA60_9ASCO|nr:hypothetical protein CANCADRAFT_126349 [Tortispora caseinolytica NRRL Y-17796]